MSVIEISNHVSRGSGQAQIPMASVLHCQLASTLPLLRFNTNICVSRSSSYSQSWALRPVSPCPEIPHSDYWLAIDASLHHTRLSQQIVARLIKIPQAAFPYAGQQTAYKAKLSKVQRECLERIPAACNGALFRVASLGQSAAWWSFRPHWREPL